MMRRRGLTPHCQVWLAEESNLGGGFRLPPAHSSMKETRIDPQPFQLLFLRPLRLPLPQQARSCRCGRPLDVLGHHRAACANAGFLGRRGWVLENVAARVCREAGGRVSTNLAVRDMDLGAHNHLDGRRLEIVVDGLPLWEGHSWQLTPPWSAPSRVMASLSGAQQPQMGSL